MKKFTIIFFMLLGAYTIFSNEPAESSSIILYEDMDQVMKLAETKPTVLFFKANWCPSCNSAYKKFSEGAEQIKGINLVIVDYDKSKDLQAKYGVTYQHTFVQVADNGESIIKWNGGDISKLLENIVTGDN